MKIIWQVNSWSKERGFFDRWLVARTDDLVPLDRYTLEFLVTDEHQYRQEILSLRHLFEEGTGAGHDFADLSHRRVLVLDYFERPDGTPITFAQIIREREGNPNLVSVPMHLKEHDIELMMSQNSPIPDDPLSHIQMSQIEIDCLSYFVRDAGELRGSKYRIGNSPRLCSGGGREGRWLENHSEELVRSFVTAFRRLYMSGEPGNFEKACDVYCRHFLNKRLTRWVEAMKVEYVTYLSSHAASLIATSQSFSTKRLLDVFIYTRYAHQPDAKGVRQFNECLDEVSDESTLVWLFCSALLTVSKYYLDVLPYIEQELAWYLNASGRKPSIACRPLVDGKSPSSKEIVDAAKFRRLQSYAVRMGEDLWRSAATPEGKLSEYVDEAQRLLGGNLQRLGVRFD